jgi:Tol biopolymer transport system component
MNYELPKILIFSIISCGLLLVKCSDETKQTTQPQDTTPPNVTITFPIDGSTVSEITKITCVATDDIGISMVELWVDGVSTGATDDAEPYSLYWNTTTFEDSSTHTITIRAYDLSDKKTDSDPILLTVDNSAAHPSISKIYPIIHSGSSFIVSWSKNNDYDFFSYILYESLTDSINWLSIFNTSDRQDTTFTVNGVSNNENRYYKIVTKDSAGLESGSLVKVGSTYQKIVFTAPGSDHLTDIFIMDINGMAKRNITNHKDHDLFSDFSPDGSRILFSSNRNGNADIYIINVDGSNLIRLTNSIEDEYAAKFSPDGSKIAYRVNVAQYSELYIMNADGNGKKRLTNNNGLDTDPNFSSNGLKIIFTSYSDGNGEIFKMNTDGSYQENITNDTNSTDYYPRFFQNDNRILFNKSSGINSQIYKMDSDGNNQENLTNDPSENIEQQLSPDENSIVYVSSRTGNQEIFIMKIDGTNQINLSNNPRSDYDPQFSPDGTKIVFVSTRDVGNGAEIYIMNIDGSGQKNISNTPVSEENPFFQPLD